MIVPIDDLMAMPEFVGKSETVMQMKLNALEQLIRSYTNNNFQNRNVRFKGNTLGNRIFGGSPYLSVNDTVQITQSGVNDGLYTITEIASNFIRVDRSLFMVDNNLVTKVEYPVDIYVGVINLLTWEVSNRQKVGIKAETLSRHSVTYFDQDASNSIMGYPVSLLGFLQPYMKARF